MREISERLQSIITSAEPGLRQITPEESSKPLRAGGWSAREVLGHLIDSASNNHQRFVRACLQDSLEFPSYDQEGCVRIEAPQEADWPLLISLWADYNRYLAHIIARLPAAKLETTCRIGSEGTMPLRSVVAGYITHLIHHLGQIGVAD